MAISDNTRSNDSRRWEELYQQMQQSMTTFQEQQGRVNEQLRELITGLSRQVLQMANNSAVVSGSSGGNNQNSLSRLSKIDFPKFGGEDVQGWSYKCEQFFEVDSTPDNMKVKIVAIHLNGKALLWHQSFVKNREEWPEWEQYKKAIIAKFGAGAFDDPLAD